MLAGLFWISNWTGAGSSVHDDRTSCNALTVFYVPDP